MATGSRRALAGALLAASAVAGHAQGLRHCANLAVSDALADPGVGSPTGAVLDVDLTLPADTNSSLAGGSAATRLLSHCAVGPGRQVYLTDLEADPSGLGPDPGGNPGPGAVWRMDPVTGVVSLVADGSRCGAGITNCGPTGVFVDPISLAWDWPAASLVMVDMDADPTGLGPDTNGHPGHGALMRVDPASGVVSLVSDGSQYPAGIPNGAPSIFEDPIGVAVGPDGSYYVVDQLALPMGAGSPGAVFKVDRTTGTVTLVAVSPAFVGLRDIAAEPSGTLLVADRLAGGNGTVFRVDPTLAPDADIVAELNSPDFVELSGITCAGDDAIHVADASADPLGTPTSPGTGAIFGIDTALTAATVESSTDQYRAPWSVATIWPESLDSAVPGAGTIGTSLSVTLGGGVFTPTPLVDFGPDVRIDAVNWISATQLSVDITILPTAAAGFVDVTVTNPSPIQTQAFHCDLFELRAVTGCSPTLPVPDDLRVTRVGDDLHLAWSPVTGDACLAGYHVHRSASPRPAALPGTWPSDPDFRDVSGQDLDGISTNASFDAHRTTSPLECFLVVGASSGGGEGPVGAYGR